MSVFGQTPNTAVGATPPATTSQFSLGAGDPGAARTTQPTFSLGGGPKFALTATSAPTAIAAAATAATSAPVFGASFSQPAASSSFAAPTFSLGSGPKFALTATSAPTIAAAVTAATSAPVFGASFSQPAASNSFAAPSTTFAVPSTTFAAPSTTFAAPSTTFAAPSTAFPASSTTTLSFPTVGSTFTAPTTTFTPSSTFSTPSTTFTTPSTTFPVSSTTFTAAPTSTPTVAAASAPATTGQTTLGTSTSVTNSSAASASSLNFCQLEEAINKWTLELEEQEKLFMNQASQVNAWDRLLIANGEKIINLNNAVEQVKLEQQQLDHELDFILAQQRELEDLLTPLEKELETNSVSDPEREHTYQLAENLDTQLKQMSEDLKEIVEHINETNRSQDNTDPIVQIGRILNAHMNSLQWIDQNTTLIGSHLDQVAKLHEVHRRENERSFRLTYD